MTSLHHRFPSACIALLVYSALALHALAEDAKLPEGTTQLLGKLSAFIAEEMMAADVKIETAEKSALALLAEHQDKEAKQGNLDNVLALRKIKKLEGVSKADPALPFESQAVIKRYLSYAKTGRIKLEKEIAEKRTAVLSLLKKQVIEQTKEGNVDMAVAIRGEIGKLEAESLKYTQRDLVDALLKYTWGWHPKGSGIRLKFNKDGGVWHLGMHGNWAVVGERKVMISPADGHRKILMEFNEELTSWREPNEGEFGGIRREARSPKK